MSAPVVYVTLRDGDGGDAPVDLEGRLLKLEVLDVDSGTDTAKLTLDNSDLAMLDDATWRKGQKLEISWGLSDDMRPPRPFVIQRVKGFETLTVELHGEVSALNREKRARAFVNCTDSEIVEQVAAEHGYFGGFRHVQPTSLRHDYVNQAGETDAQLLARLARRNGFRFRIDDDGLVWGPRKLDGRPVLAFEYRVGADVLRVNPDSDVALQPAVVTVKGTNPETGEAFEAEAKDGASGQTALSDEVEVIDPRSGASTVAGRTASGTVVNTAAGSKEEAELEAKRRYQAASMERVRLDLTVAPTKANGAVRARGGILATLTNVGQHLSGVYYVNEAKHTVDGSAGFEVMLKMSRQGPASGGAARTQDPVNQNDPVAPDDLIEVVDPRSGDRSLRRPS